MLRYYRFIVLFLFSLIFSAQTVFACRFNVRETGFVDFNGEQYILIGYTDNNVPPEIIDIFHSTAREMLSESNVIFELINTERQKNHPAINYLKENDITALPALLLISPDGQTLVFPLEPSKQKFKKSLTKAINQIRYSPARQKLQDLIIDAYGVVFIIEGANKNKNAAAKKAAENAVENITKKMDLMPKPIKNPPVIFRLKYNERFNESVLLWVLGLNSDEKATYAAVLYGKVRWLGPLFKDKEISKQNLSEILFIVGADCECGLDKNWLRGTALPMIWSKKYSKRIAENLGFDPENPLTKIEINQIMRMGRYISTKNAAYPATLSSHATTNIPAADINFYKSKQKDLKNKDIQPDSSILQKRSPIAKSIIITIIILSILFSVGLIIVFVNSKRNDKNYF